MITGLVVLAVIFLTVSSILWLLSDTDFNFKACVQHPATYFFTVVLCFVAAMVAAYDESSNGN